MTAPTQDLTALLNTLQSAQTTAPTADTIDTPPVHHTPLALPQGPLSPSGTSSSLPPSEPLERFGDRYFAPRSRIFVGNLASSDITEADIRTIFQPYGKIEVITLKSTYGFVQYDNPDSCARALQNENGRMIKGVRLELDLSKASNAKPPGRGRGEQRFDPYKREDGGRGRGMGRGRGRRSASPGPNYPPPFHPMPPPRRGPPPPAPGYGAPQYDAPYDRPYRTSMEPDGEYARRYAQPPFCQILVLDDLDRNFVGFVEGALKRAQITVEAMALPPHVQIRTAVLQKIREGVRAVIFLERKHEQYGRVSLQVFEPRVGDTGVKFEEYEDIRVEDAVNILLRAKGPLIHDAYARTSLPPGPAPYVPPHPQGMPERGPLPYTQPPMLPMAPLSHVPPAIPLPQVDINAVSSLLNTLKATQMHPPPTAPRNYPISPTSGQNAVNHLLDMLNPSKPHQ